MNSSLRWMTSTGSVWSTQTIRISPSASSSVPSRSMRRVTRAMVAAGASGGSGRVSGRGRGAFARGEPCRPLGLERVAQAVARILERHAGDDGLEEPEDDELARLVGRDAPALQVEQLVLVD